MSIREKTKADTGYQKALEIIALLGGRLDRAKDLLAAAIQIHELRGSGVKEKQDLIDAWFKSVRDFLKEGK